MQLVGFAESQYRPMEYLMICYILLSDKPTAGLHHDQRSTTEEGEEGTREPREGAFPSLPSPILSLALLLHNRHVLYIVLLVLLSLVQSFCLLVGY